MRLWVKEPTDMRNALHLSLWEAISIKYSLDRDPGLLPPVLSSAYTLSFSREMSQPASILVPSVETDSPLITS